MPKPRVTLFFEFASTYSYLTAMRVADLAHTRGVDLVWQPFLLGPIFQAQGWTTSPFNLYPAKGRYMWRDLARRADRQGLPPVVAPEPFPQNGLLAARIATLGLEKSWGPDFIRGVFTAQFARGEAISDPACLASILESLGVNAEDSIRSAQTDQSAKDKLRAATQHATDLGLFGAPSFVTADGELFWGDDRLEDALDWALMTAK
ncbi:MAG: 2-hydroxychromene-2-carboxylate isomerase [Pseudomonadota bacterium]